jgi:hypothetical protein
MEYKPVDIENLREECKNWDSPSFCLEDALDEIEFLRKALEQSQSVVEMEPLNSVYGPIYGFSIDNSIGPDQTPELAAYLAHGTEPSDSEPKASSTGEDGRSQEAADGGKAVMEGDE